VVARGLLGCVVAGRGVSVRLTEVEAYAGTADPASHAFRGPTPRSAVMFGPAGHLYVYFVYGMHWCANLVCEREGIAAAVLLRAGEVVAGQHLAWQRRPAARSARDLARGPAKLATVLDLTGADTGADLCRAASPVRALSGEPVPEAAIRTGPRVGVAAAGEWPWRWWLDGDPTVSEYRPRTRRGGVPGPAGPPSRSPDTG
jgi:DNA-3-methyladenine glycosylase